MQLPITVDSPAVFSPEKKAYYVDRKNAAGIASTSPLLRTLSGTSYWIAA